MKAQDDGRMLTVNEAAKRLGLSPWTLRAWMSRRKVAYVTIAAADSAPQEAAGAAMACIIAIGPYVVARSLGEMLRPRR